MAAPQEMILKLVFNDDGTFAGLEEVNKELKKVDDTTKDTTKGFTSAKAELRALQNQMLQMDQSSEEFKKASSRAAELKDNISDLSAEINANAGNAFEGLSNNVGLFGSRLMSLDLKGAGQALSGMGNAVARIDFKTLKDEVGGLVKGFTDLAFAVVSNPYLLLGSAVVALGYTFRKELLSPITNIIAANDKLRESIKFTSEEITAAAGDEVKQIAKLEELKIVLNDTTTSTKNRKEAVKELKKINPTYFKDLDDEKIKYTDLNTQIDTYIKGLVAQSLAKAASSRIEQESAKYLDDEIKRKQDLETVTAKLAIAQAELADKSKAVEESGKNIFGGKSYGAGYERAKTTAAATGYSIQQLELEKKALIDSEATSKSAYEQRVKDLTNFKKTQEEIAAGFGVTTPGADDKDKKDLEKQLEANAIRAAEELKFEKHLADEKLKIQQEYIEANQSAQANELYELQKRKELELQTYEGAEEDKVLILDKYRILEADVNKKYDDLALQQQIEANEKEKAEREKLNEANAIAAAKELALEKKLEEEKRALRVANIQSGFEMAQLAVGALIDLNDAAAKGDDASQRKTFERNKMLQKAQATIAMASGIVQQLAVPQDQLTGMNFVKAAALAATGIANIVKINQTQFGGSVPSPSSGNINMPTSGANAPAIDFSGGQFNPNGPGTVETYVLAGNVANALEARQKIIDQSYL